MKKVIYLFLLIGLFFSSTPVFAEANNISLTYNDKSIILNLSRNGSSSVEYDFSYHADKKIAGEWYQDLEDDSQESLNITSYTDSEITFDIMRNGDALYSNIKAELEGTYGEFNSSYQDIRGTLEIVEKDEIDLYIKSKKAEIFGLVSTFGYDDSKILFDTCTPFNDFEFSKNENNIVFESDIRHENELIGICNFKKINNDNFEISMQRLSLSTSDGFVQNNTISINGENKVVYSVYDGGALDDTAVIAADEDFSDDSTEILKRVLIGIIIVTIIAIIAIGLVFLFKNEDAIKILKGFFIFAIALLPVLGSVYATIEDVDKIRSFLLLETTSKNGLKDFDNDRRITINDLILGKIDSLKPSIEFTDEEVTMEEDNASYATEATRIIKVKSNYKVSSAEYCMTDRTECTPTTATSVSNKNEIILAFTDNVAPQRLCVKVTNVRGYSATKCDDKTYLVDSEAPKLSVKNENIIVRSFDDYTDYENNVNVQHGVSGIKSLSCIELQDETATDSKTVDCIATGNNGLSTLVVFKIVIGDQDENKTPAPVEPSEPDNPGPVEEPEPTEPTILFIGDSITEAVLSPNNGWPEKIAKKYGIKTINRGSSGITVSCRVNDDYTIKSGTWCLPTYVDMITDKATVVILSGAINDIISNPNVTVDFLTQYLLFKQHLALYIDKARAKWPNAQIGYIMTYDTPCMNDYDTGKASSFFTGAADVLREKGVPNFDLSSAPYMLDIHSGCTESSMYLPDHLHLNEAGYNVLVDPIYNWLHSTFGV